MLESIKHAQFVKRIRKSPFYSRARQYFPMSEYYFIDDRDQIDDAEIVLINWPVHINKPTIGIVRDYGENPRWTKYCRFLDNNSFPYAIYNIHAQNWIEKASDYDIVVGIVSSELYDLQEIRKKYYVLETFLGISCYPSTNHVLLYEDKNLEAYISKIFDIPFANTYVSYDKEDAFKLIEKLTYPIVCKIVPASGSVGVELVSNLKQSRKIIEQAFSRSGRKTHTIYFRQKNYIHFQDYIPNDGYDIRVIVIGNWTFGYYRKVIEGDFRASGMNLVEKRELPEEAMKIARKVNNVIRSPMLVVDMLHGLDGKYYVVEFSPFCQVETPEQLHVDAVPGVYVFDKDDTFRFEGGRYWVHELALREFLMNDHLPKIYK